MFFLLTVIFSALFGCSYKNLNTRDGAPGTSVKAIFAPNPIPKYERKSKYGNSRTYKVKGKTYHVLKTANNYHKIGIASWYGTMFHGRLTSSREPYNMFALTAASKELPIPCFVKVRNLENNKEVIVRVNDRGPFKPGRIMDLSYAAAQKLGMMKKGTAKVEIRHIKTAKKAKTRNLGKKSISLGYFKNNSSVSKIKSKLQKYKFANKLYLIKKDQLTHVMIGPLSIKELSQFKKISRKLRYKFKIM